jgi:uncharacterized protein YdbL (DUF1318 family)
MKNVLIIRLAFLLAAVVPGAVVVGAEDLNSVKARMNQRLNVVETLKDRGVAGENNRGYLDVRGQGSADDQRVIAQENADRRTVYAAIASAEKISPDAVGRRRAQQIAGLARPGHWIQDAAGAWKKK